MCGYTGLRRRRRPRSVRLCPPGKRLKGVPDGRLFTLRMHNAAAGEGERSGKARRRALGLRASAAGPADDFPAHLARLAPAPLFRSRTIQPAANPSVSARVRQDDGQKRSTDFDADFDADDFFGSADGAGGADGRPRSRRRRRKWDPRRDGAPPPQPKRLLCSGMEDALRRAWDLLSLGNEGPEWERFRMREYLMDAEEDLRAIYDWYR